MGEKGKQLESVHGKGRTKNMESICAEHLISQWSLIDRNEISCEIRDAGKQWWISEVEEKSNGLKPSNIISKSCDTMLLQPIEK